MISAFVLTAVEIFKEVVEGLERKRYSVPANGCSAVIIVFPDDFLSFGPNRLNRVDSECVLGTFLLRTCRSALNVARQSG